MDQTPETSTETPVELGAWAQNGTAAAAEAEAVARRKHEDWARERERENAQAMASILEPIFPPKRGVFVRALRWIGRLFAPSAPAPSETEIATRLLCAWSLGNSEQADEVHQGLAVLTARQIRALTEGR